MICKDKTKVENTVVNLLDESISQLIENYFDTNGISSPAEELNKLLASYFTHQDRNQLHYNPTETSDTVFTVTNTISFIVKLNEYCLQKATIIKFNEEKPQ
jgi:hypothetical protein